MRYIALAASVALAVVAAPATGQQPSIQEQFEAASSALSTERWAEALRLFEALEAGGPRGARTIGLIRVRKAEALARLGRRAEAEASVRLGLPALPTDDPTLIEDRFLGVLNLGQLLERKLDYREALQHYRASEALPIGDAVKLRVYRGLVQTGMFHDPAAALADADRALVLARTAAPDNHDLIGQFRSLRGRVLLNMGRFDDARRELSAATNMLGGMTLRVGAADLVARSDAAIASLLARDPDGARRYLAYTGAGRLTDPFLPGVTMAPPPCGPDVRATDVAVVEFSLQEDGSVGHAAPVYASRLGTVGETFAKAVLDWSWAPHAVAQIPPLFRVLTRVELRCSFAPETEMELPEEDRPPDLWPRDRIMETESPVEDTYSARATMIRQQISRLQAADGAATPTLFPLFFDLAINPAVPHAEQVTFIRRALEIARHSAGLRLKHDHRHEDGSEDLLTQYGGDTTAPGNPRRQEFPVDQFSKDMFVANDIPQSATNVWAMEVVPGQMFAYELKRPNRYLRAEFDLTRPVAPPPPPWGSD